MNAHFTGDHNQVSVDIVRLISVFSSLLLGQPALLLQVRPADHLGAEEAAAVARHDLALRADRVKGFLGK